MAVGNGQLRAAPATHHAVEMNFEMHRTGPRQGSQRRPRDAGETEALFYVGRLQPRYAAAQSDARFVDEVPAVDAPDVDRSRRTARDDPARLPDVERNVERSCQIVEGSKWNDPHRNAARDRVGNKRNEGSVAAGRYDKVVACGAWTAGVFDAGDAGRREFGTHERGQLATPARPAIDDKPRDHRSRLLKISPQPAPARRSPAAILTARTAAQTATAPEVAAPPSNTA